MAHSGDEVTFQTVLKSIKLHDHLCMIYENPEEQFRMIMPFMKIGLLRNEKCVYIADDNTVAVVLDAMKSVDKKLFETSLQNGHLSILTKNDTYLQDGVFDPKKMMVFWRRAVDEAVAGGFSGVRATGEMTWIFGGDPGTERLIEYEAMLNDFFPKNPACAVCQYNRKRFSRELLIEVFRVHPKVMYRDRIIKNPLYLSVRESKVLEKEMLGILDS